MLRSHWAEQNSLAHAKSTGPRLLYMTLVAIATLQVKVFAWSPFGDQFFRFSETFFTNQVASFKILGAVATKMVAT